MCNKKPESAAEPPPLNKWELNPDSGASGPGLVAELCTLCFGLLTTIFVSLLSTCRSDGAVKAVKRM